jgi:hypothetical protein
MTILQRDRCGDMTEEELKVVADMVSQWCGYDTKSTGEKIG